MSVLDSAEVLDVTGYAAAVRRSLADLGPDQVDDLTDDLEADLADALADERHNAHGRGVLEQFGPPEEYAAELRAAAGLLPVAEPKRRPVRELAGAPKASLVRLLGHLRDEHWWPPVEGFLVALRPVWWLVRAWVGYELIVLFLGIIGWVPRSVGPLLLLAVFSVLSVQWGRGVWFGTGSWRGVAAACNVLAIVAVLPLVLGLHASEGTGTVTYVTDSATPTDGVYVGGTPVSNLFAYDSEGNPLTDVQIFDEQGRPVLTADPNSSAPMWFPMNDEPWTLLSSSDADGRTRWNVYPLRGAPSSSFDQDAQLSVGKSALIPPAPFAKAPALSAATDATADPAEPASTPAPSTSSGTGAPTDGVSLPAAP